LLIHFPFFFLRINPWGTRHFRAHNFHRVVYCCHTSIYILLCLYCCFTPVHYRFHSDPRRPVPERYGPGGCGCRLQSSFLLGNASEASSFAFALHITNELSIFLKCVVFSTFCFMSLASYELYTYIFI
jgi:hypothetical protein